MDSKILLGVIALTIFGTLAAQSMMAQAGMFPIETTQIIGDPAVISPGDSGTSSAQCPDTHPFLIGGSYSVVDNGGPHFAQGMFFTDSNTYTASGSTSPIGPEITIRAFALCANFNFPMSMGMVGGELLDIDSISLLVGAIGVNPVITALVGVSLAGVAAQAVWFVHQRKKKNS